MDHNGQYHVHVSPNRDFTRCILCGCQPKGDRESRWLGMIRVLHRTSDGEVLLSEVVSKYRPSENDSCLRVTWSDLWDRGPCRFSPTGLFYIFHAQCWQYLTECLGEQGPVDRERLYDVLLKLPAPKGVILDSRASIYANLESLAEPLFDNPPDNAGYFCKGPTIQDLLNEASDIPSPTPRLSVSTDSSRDPFAHLPFELRLNIAILLRTRTFYNLRYVSRTFTPIFRDNMFWKSRFSKDGDRGFLHPVVMDGPVDWRSLYRATARSEDKFRMRLKVWEILQWIRETLETTRNPSLRTLDFYGRALQDYHADSAAQGQRIERVRMPENLIQIAVSMISGPDIHRRQRYINQTLPPGQPVTEITALEFISANGSRETIGCRDRDPMARTVTAEELSGELYRKEITEKVCNTTKGSIGPVSPFDHHGVRVLFEAAPFKGFHIRYDEEGISSIGVLRQDAASSAFAMCVKMAVSGSKEVFLAQSPYVCGYHADRSTFFDMDMDEVVEVVGTFDNRKLVDLGVRGHRRAVPLAVSDPEFFSNVGHGRPTVRFGKRQESKRRVEKLQSLGQGVYVYRVVD